LASSVTINDPAISQGIAGTGTIGDDDQPPSLTINDAGVMEGNAGTANAVFAVTLSAIAGRDITVHYAAADGTDPYAATLADNDFVARSGTLTIPVGQTTGTITVPVKGDTNYEADETFYVNLSNPVNATIADGQGVGTILNDDIPPTLTISDASATEGNSGTKDLVFTVTLSQPSVTETRVDYVTADGTATLANGDYTEISPPLPGLLAQYYQCAAVGNFSTATLVLTRVDPTVNFDWGTGSPDPLVPADLFAARWTGKIKPLFSETYTFSTNSDDGVRLWVNNQQVIGDWVDHSPMVNTGTIALVAGQMYDLRLEYYENLGDAVMQLSWSSPSTPQQIVPSTALVTSLSNTLVIPAGQTTGTITVPVKGDTTYEANETFYVNLSNPVNATLGAKSQGVGTIQNDDALPTVSFTADASGNEGDVGPNPISFTVSLSAVSGLPVTVNWATSNGTGIAGTDYAAASGIATFSPGTLTTTIAVYTIADYMDEANKTFTVTLTSPSGATLGAKPTATGTVTDDDLAPTLSIDDVSVTEGNTGTTPAVFHVSLSAASGYTVTVNWATAAGTATATTDYTTASGVLTFAPGDITKTASVSVKGDTLSETNETFYVNLTSPVNATLAKAQGVGTILDDDLLPVASITGPAPQNEGNFSNTTMTFTVTLSAISGQQVTVNYTTVDGTATANSDYIPVTNGTLVFTAGQTTKAFTITVKADTTAEADETFSVRLTAGTTYSISPTAGEAVATILNDDKPALRIDDASVIEGDSGMVSLTFTVSLSVAFSQTITIAWATFDATAVAGLDYLAAGGTITFGPGETSKPITISVLGDTLAEADETFQVRLSNATNATIAVGTGTGTIIDDDYPAFSINDPTVTEGDSGMAGLTFTVSLDVPCGHTVTADWATFDGTAVAGLDYLAAGGTVAFGPGETSKPITVSVLGNLLSEADRTFQVRLSNASDASIVKGTGTGTIIDDDYPTLSINDPKVTEGDSGMAALTFTATLGKKASHTITADWATFDGTALAGLDYLAAGGTVTFAPGETSKSITVSVFGDMQCEQDETFQVRLSNAPDATIAKGTGTATILNDDGEHGRVWADLSGNGIQDAGEPGVAGAVVEIFSSTDGTIGNADDISRGVAITAADGRYAFSWLPDGTQYYEVFRTPVGYTFTTQHVGTDPTRDSDANSTGVTAIFTVAPGLSRTLDAGLRGAAPGFGFALDVGAGTWSYGPCLATDAAGNVYVTGYLSGTADFDPGPGVYNLTSAGSADVLVAGYSAAGALLWARRLGGTDIDAGQGLAVAGDGSVYTTGLFSGTADFDPGPGTFNLTSAGAYDVFVSKLDSGGHFVWARRVGGADNDAAHGIAVAADGSVYTAGGFSGTVDFDPGPGIFNLSSVDSGGFFVSKLDSAGNFVWARACGGGTSYLRVNGITLASDGSAYTTGSFSDTADFDPGPGTFNLTSAGQNDVFVSKLSSAGNFVWARSFAGTGWDEGNGIAVAPDGSAYTTGFFKDTVDFDPGPGTFNLTNAGGPNEAFVSKLDSAGNFVWARRLGGAGDDGGGGLAVASDGSVYTTGSFSDTADFDPGPAMYNLTSAGNRDVFVSKLDSAGNFVWARRFGGTGNEDGAGLALAPDGSVYTMGNFTGTADFDPGPDTFSLASSSSGDVFVAKLQAQQVPTDVSLSSTSVPENQPWGTAVGFFSTTDLRTDTAFTYALVPGTGSTDNGSFSVMANVLRTAAVFNRTVQSQYSIRVRTTDDSGLWFEKAITIQVTPAPMDWRGTLDDHWENAANWRAGIVPGPQTMVRIGGAATRQPVLYQSQTVRGIELEAGAVLAFATGAAKTLVTKSLTIAEAGGVPTARLDIGAGALIVDYDDGAASPLEDVKRWIAAGYKGMTWTGNGLASSAAALAPITHGLGYAQNDMLITPFTSFAGQPADSSSVLVKYTYAGDLNLDGYVDGRVDDNDVAILGLYYDGGATNTHTWNQGDLFGYDGRIDDNDVSILGLTYGLGVGNPLGGGAAAVTLATPTEPAAQPAAALVAATIAPAAVVLSAAASLAPATLVDEPAALDAAVLALVLGKATLASAAPVLAAPSMAPPATAAPEADGFGALLAIDSAIVDAVPLVFGAGDEVAPPRPEPVLVPAGDTMDLLTLPALEVPPGV
jgi:hypothetical protein